MNDAHVYEMQVQMWKPNTWGVIVATPDQQPITQLFAWDEQRLSLGDLVGSH